MMFPTKPRPTDKFLDIARATPKSVSTMPGYGDIRTRKLSPTEMLSDMDNGNYFPPSIADREVVSDNPYGRINSAYDTDMLYNPMDTLKGNVMNRSTNTPEVISNQGVAIPMNPNDPQMYNPNAVPAPGTSPVAQPYGSYDVIRSPNAPIVGPKQDFILNRIREAEGTSKTGFGTWYGYDKSVPPADTLTLNEILKIQKGNNSAAGGFQFKSNTLKDVMRNMKLTGNEKFTADLQTQMIMSRLKSKRGYSDWFNGKITNEQFQSKLSREFSSLKDPVTGKGHYNHGGKHNIW